jgi:hypothetical protein
VENIIKVFRLNINKKKSKRDRGKKEKKENCNCTLPLIPRRLFSSKIGDLHNFSVSCGILKDLRFIIFCVCNSLSHPSCRNLIKTVCYAFMKIIVLLKTKLYNFVSNRCQYLELTEILAPVSCGLHFYREQKLVTD